MTEAASTSDPGSLSLALALTAVAWLILIWPWASGTYTVPWDAKAHFLPQVQFMASSFARGESLAWTPFVFSGHPQIADPQSQIHSPPMLLLAMLDEAPTGWAMDMTVFACVLVAMLALVVWWRDQGWRLEGGVLAAVCFGFGAAMAWRIQHVGQVVSMSYLPLIMLCLYRSLRPRDRSSGETVPRVWRSLTSVIYGLPAGVLAAYMVLGRDQVALLNVYLLAAYVLWLLASDPRGALRASLAAIPALTVAAVAGAAIIARPILLTLLMAEQSNRPEIDYAGAAAGSLHPVLLLTAIAPDVFGSTGPMEDYWGPPSYAWQGTGLFIAQNMGQVYFGFIPLLVLIYALFRGWLFHREIMPFLIAAVFVLAYALGWYTPLFQFAHTWLPGVDLYRRPADAMFQIGFFAALLSGYAAGRLIQVTDTGLESNRTWWPVTAIIALSFAALLALAIGFGRLEQATPAIAAALAIALASALALATAIYLRAIRPGAAVALAFSVLIADLAYSNGPGGATALPARHYDVLDPGTRNETILALKERVQTTPRCRDRVELAGLGFHWPNASLTHRLEHTLGYNPVRLDHYTRAVGAGDTIGLVSQRTFSPLFPSYGSSLADQLGLRFIATPVPIETFDKKLRPGDLETVATTPEGFIYENPGVHPRVALKANWAAADFEEIIATGNWPHGVDLAANLLIDHAEAEAMAKLLPQDPSRRLPSKAAAMIRSYTNAEVVIETQSSHPAVLLLNDIHHRWWTATVNASPARVFRANVLFRAVVVPSGNARVVFRFAPEQMPLGELVGSWLEKRKRVREVSAGREASQAPPHLARPNDATETTPPAKSAVSPVMPAALCNEPATSASARNAGSQSPQAPPIP